MKNIARKLWNLAVLRMTYLYISIIISWAFLISKKEYYGAKLFLFNYRLLYEYSSFQEGRKIVDNICVKHYERFFCFIIEKYVKGDNTLYHSFIKSKEAKKFRKYFSRLDDRNYVSLRYPKKNDYKERQGDLMVLKPYIPENNEKGVLIIHYTESIGKFAAMFDLNEIAKRYRIVLEPSWWGYQNIYFLFLLFLPTEIIIESPYEKDYDYVKNLNHNFYPIKVGAGDWVDPETFIDGKGDKKKYDIVMVGNWSKVKRHEVLFRAVSKMSNRQDTKIALIGYPSAGRTKFEILKEANRYNLEGNVTVYENIKAEEVSQILRESKVNVLLSIGEGGNRGIYEGLFSGNIIILYARNKGVNKDIINEYTGFLTDDGELPEVLNRAIECYHAYDTRKWASENTGYVISSRKLNELIRDIAKEKGETWTEDIAYKTNRPNGLYADERHRVMLEPEYIELKKYLIKDS